MVKVFHIGYEHRYKDTRIVKKECKALMETGKYDITFITSNKNSKEGDFTEGDIKLKVMPLRTQRKGIKLAKYMRDVLSFINEEKPDICHIHEYVLLPLIGALKKHNIKVVYDKHEDTFEELNKKFSNRFGDKIGSKLAGLIAKYENQKILSSDAFIWVSPDMTCFDERVIEQANLIANFPSYKHTEDISYDTYKLNINNLAFAGGISANWSIDKVVEALSNQDNIKLNLAGPVSVSSYLERLKKINGFKNVNYLGKIPYEEVENLYSQSGIGLALLNSPIEKYNRVGVLGNTKIFEIMMAGLPVICSKNKLWQDMTEKYDCGITINPADENEILDAARYLINNPKRAFEMGRHGKEAIKKEYNWELHKGRLLDIYDNLDSGKASYIK